MERGDDRFRSEGQPTETDADSAGIVQPTRSDLGESAL
jgi:hypothetical protein